MHKTFLYLGLFLLLTTLSFAHLDPYPPVQGGMGQGQGFMPGGAYGLPQYGFTDPYTAATSPYVSYLNGAISPYPPGRNGITQPSFSNSCQSCCEDSGANQVQRYQEAAIVFGTPNHFDNPQYALSQIDVQIEHDPHTTVDESSDHYTVTDPTIWHNDVEYAQNIHDYTNQYTKYTHVDDETQTFNNYYDSIDPISSEQFKQLSPAEQFEYRQGHHRLFSDTGIGQSNWGIQSCSKGSFVNSLEVRNPRIDFLPGGELRPGMRDFNPGAMETRNRGGFASGTMETRNRGGFSPGQEETRDRTGFTPGALESRNRGGFIPGPMELRNRGGFIPGPDEIRNRGGFVPGPDEFRNRGGFNPGPMEFRDRTGFIPGPMELRNRGGFIGGIDTFAPNPSFNPNPEIRTPKNQWIYSDP